MRGDVEKDRDVELNALRRRSVEEYLTALTVQPTNLVIAMRAGAMLEQMNEFPTALRLYARGVQQWPNVFSVRYRLAAVLSFAEPLSNQLQSYDRSVVTARLNDLGTASEETADSREGLLRAASRQWSTLERSQRRCVMLRRWWRVHVRRRTDDRINLRDCFSRERRQLKSLAALAGVVTEIQRDGKWVTRIVSTKLGVEPIKEIERHVERRGQHAWRLLYNAACAYGRLVEAADRAEKTDSIINGLADIAVARLQEAYRHPHSTLGYEWISADPDLVRLRKTPAWQQSFGWGPIDLLRQSSDPDRM